MKQKLLIGVWIISCTMFLASCGRNTENNAAMKMPLESSREPGGRPPGNLTGTTDTIIAGKTQPK
jgi:hypothetical protein